MRSRIVIIGAALLVILTVGVVFTLINGKGGQSGDQTSQETSSWRAAGDRFMNYMTSTNASAAYAMLSDRMKAENPEDQWQAQIASSFKDFTGKAEFDSLGVLKNNSAYEKSSDPHLLVYNLTIKGDKWQTTFIIFLQDGNWRVDSMRSYRR